MKKLLSLESPAMRFLTLLSNLLILNTLFLLTSLPVVTIGASWCALQTSIQAILRKRDDKVFVHYFRAFQVNFKQATLAFLGIILFGVIFYGDFRLLGRLPLPLAFLLGIGTMIAVGLLIIESSYLFAYLGRYQDRIQVAIKNVLILSIQNLFQTIFLIVYNSFIVYFTISSPAALLTMIYIFTFGGIAFLNYFSGIMMKQVFDRIERKNKNEKERNKI